MDVTKYLLNNNLIWPGDDSTTDQGGENPMMFDISLSEFSLSNFIKLSSFLIVVLDNLAYALAVVVTASPPPPVMLIVGVDV